MEKWNTPEQSQTHGKPIIPNIMVPWNEGNFVLKVLSFLHYNEAEMYENV